MKVGGAFSVELFGDQDVAAAFKRLSAIGRVEALRDTAQQTYQVAKFEVDGHTKTGALARSIDIVKESDEWFVGHRNGPRHALFVHWGTKPHKIRPRKRKALRWAGGGRFTFAQVVNHPGYKGDPYFVRAAANVPRMLAAEISRRIQSGA